MTPADQVLAFLYDRRGSFAAGEEVRRAAGIGQAGLDRALAELRGRGHELELLPGRGWRLVPPIRLDACLIERTARTRRVGRSVICFAEVDSTNDVAFASARQGDTDGLAVLAELQHKGRGRLGRKWISPPAANLQLSVLLIEPPGEHLPCEAVPVAAGVAVAEAIEAVCTAACRLKWPNDVLVAGAKAAGILVERRCQAGQGPDRDASRRETSRQCVVIGVGINVNAAPPAEEVDRPATCLADQVGGPLERNGLAAAVLTHLDRWIAAVADGRLDELRDAWGRRCGMLNQRVTVAFAGRDHVGRVLDISPLEGLVLLDDGGAQLHLPAMGSTVRC